MLDAGSSLTCLQGCSNELRFNQSRIIAVQDNNETIEWGTGKDGKQLSRQKHSNIQPKYITELVQNDVLSLQKLPTAEMMAKVYENNVGADSVPRSAKKA